MVNKRSEAPFFRGVARDNDGVLQPNSNVACQDKPNFRKVDKDKLYMLKSSRDVTNVGRSLMRNKVLNKRAELTSLPRLAVADTKSFQPAAVATQEPNPISVNENSLEMHS